MGWRRVDIGVDADSVVAIRFNPPAGAGDRSAKPPVAVPLLDASGVGFHECPSVDMVSLPPAPVSERARVAGAPDGSGGLRPLCRQQYRGRIHGPRRMPRAQEGSMNTRHLSIRNTLLRKRGAGSVVAQAVSPVRIPHACGFFIIVRTATCPRTSRRGTVPARRSGGRSRPSSLPA
jgi:hypothetical protein